ncbi:MAG: DUF2953 domain-containing protein [Ruminiclostridium sp.]
MTGWIIFGSILLVLIFLFTRHVTITAVYDKNPEITVKYLFITLFRLPQKPKRKKKRKRKKEKELKAEPIKENSGGENNKSESEAAEGDTDTKEETPSETDALPKDNKTAAKGAKPKPAFSLTDISLEMIKDFVESASPPIKRLFKKIKVRDLYIDYVVGSDDAAKTAIKYGSLCAVVYSVLKWLTLYFDVKAKEVNIEADFKAEKDDIFVYTKVKMRISTALGCVLWLAVRVLKTYLKYSRNLKPQRA